MKGISIRKDVLGGQPVIKGTRIPVSSVLYQMSNNKGRGHVRDYFPQLKQEQIDAALRFAGDQVNEING